MLRVLAAAAVALVGVGLLVVGAALVYRPAGFLVGGLFLLVAGALLVDVTG